MKGKGGRIRKMGICGRAEPKQGNAKQRPGTQRHGQSGIRYPHGMRAG